MNIAIGKIGKSIKFGPEEKGTGKKAMTAGSIDARIILLYRLKSLSPTSTKLNLFLKFSIKIFITSFSLYVFKNI